MNRTVTQAYLKTKHTIQSALPKQKHETWRMVTNYLSLQESEQDRAEIVKQFNSKFGV